jgi:hypothetical protein
MVREHSAVISAGPGRAFERSSVIGQDQGATANTGVGVVDRPARTAWASHHSLRTCEADQVRVVGFLRVPLKYLRPIRDCFRQNRKRVLIKYGSQRR